MKNLRLSALIFIFVAIWGVTGGHFARPQALSGPSVDRVDIHFEPFLSNLNKPVDLVANGIPGDNRLFIVEIEGKILVVNPNGTVRAKPFLDISDRVDQSANRNGLFGLVFHPAYVTNGYFYVHYVYRVGDLRMSRLSRFRVTDDPDVADPNSENILLTVDAPVAGHYAGDIHFGKDGYLYFPHGDGNSSTITHRPQDLTTLLGKMSRLNVDKKAGEAPADCRGAGSGDYSIPPSNPYTGSPSACDEIWAVGLRNPWRFSFDRQNGDLYLSDVGQAQWDELNYVPAGTGGGMNYGWPCYEANEIYESQHWSERGCDAGVEFTFPVISQAIGSSGDCSIIGGFVYRGSRFPDLLGRYLMTDFCSGRLRDAVRKGDDWVVTLHEQSFPPGVVSFGQGNDGELYAVNFTNSRIYRLLGGEGPPLTATPTATPSNTPPGASSTSTPTATPSNTPPPGASSTPTPTATPSNTPPPGASSTPTPTRAPVGSARIYLPAIQSISGVIPTVPATR